MPNSDQSEQSATSDATIEAARRVMRLLHDHDIPFLVSGAHALAVYTDIERQTKDFDLSLKASDIPRALDVLADEGFETEMTSEVWLAKAYLDDELIDLVFNSGHAEHPVDETWFARADEREIFGMSAQICPIEEMIRAKAFIMERGRFDGADVAHLLRCLGDEIDWDHLLDCFGDHWHVLFSHLVLFQYIYPARRNTIPDWIMEELMDRLAGEREDSPPDEDICRGTLLSRADYIVDISQWDCTDGRVRPHGNLSKQQARTLSTGGEEE